VKGRAMRIAGACGAGRRGEAGTIAKLATLTELARIDPTPRQVEWSELLVHDAPGTRDRRGAGAVSVITGSRARSVKTAAA